MNIGTKCLIAFPCFALLLGMAASAHTNPPQILEIYRDYPEAQWSRLSGPLFLLHPESESPAVVVLVNSRLAANTQAISWGVLSPWAL